MILIRMADSQDRQFIVDSWVRSYRSSKYAGFIQMKRWFPIMIEEISALVSDPRVCVFVAYDPSDADRIADIYGWCCTEIAPVDVGIAYRTLVHYIFVKGPYRRRGIGRALLEQAIGDLRKPFAYSCSTDMLESIGVRRIAPYAVFDPLPGRH